MSSTASGVHSLNIRDTGACARIDVWDAHTCAGMISIEATSSSSSKPLAGESSSSSVQGSGTDSPPLLPTRSNGLCLPSTTGDGDSEAAAQRDLRRTRVPSPPQLQSVYGLWSMCVACDVEDSRISLPLDGDIFGVGKRPVQHEVETDGCVRLVFAEVEEIDD